jgi:hypothetical protein
VIAAKQKGHTAAYKEWIAALRVGQSVAKQLALDATVDTCAEPGVTTRRIFQQFNHARARPSPREATRFLDEEETWAFWQQQYRASGDDVRRWDPLCEIDMVITAEQVRLAIKETCRTAPGPDGMDFLVFQEFAEELAPKLAEAFNRAIREGIPDALKQALTILIAKEDPPSSDPSGFRPITLLVMLIRLLHKTLQMGFREEMVKREPSKGGLYPTQAAYVQMRNGHEQVFLVQMLQALRREGTAPKKFLAVLLLDIAKAFDSLEYAVILNTLLRRQYPRVWVEIFRRILPGNSTTIMGRTILLERGTPQGGALSPDLCNLVLNELAHELMKEIEDDLTLGDLWRKRASARDHRWAIEMSALTRLCMTLVQFADDISILADSLPAARRLLLAVWRWAGRHKVCISSKSLAVLLAVERPSERIDPQPLGTGDVKLQWNVEDGFRLLGVRCQAAFTSFLHHPTMPVNKRKIGGTMAVVAQAFAMDKERDYVNPHALRMGIEQLVYASALYESALQKVDYDSILSIVMKRCRQILHLQPTTPTAYILWELRLWPPHLRAHKRAMTFAAFLLHHSWIGKKILLPYVHEASSRSRPVDDIHPIFGLGPLKYITETLRLYGVSWYTVLAKWNKDWKARGQVAMIIQRELLLPRYVEYLRDKVLSAKDIPSYHRQQLLRDMGLPPPSDINSARRTPIYHDMDGDLPRAGFAFRAPYLRYQNRGEYVPRASCKWCGEYEGECGYHFVRCPSLPQREATLLDRALRLIHRDVRAALGLQQPLADYGDAIGHLEEQNLQRLYNLSWEGRGLWQTGRSDGGKQPGRDALRACLFFMRDTVNAYSAVVPEVRALPVYQLAPDLTDREKTIAAQARECLRASEAATREATGRPSQDSTGWSSQDSLQALRPPDDDW